MAGEKMHRMGYVGDVTHLLVKEAPQLARRPRNARMDALMKHVHSSELHSFERVAKAVDAIRSKKESKA